MLIILRLQMIIQKMYFKYIKDPFPRAALFTITSQQVNMGIKLLKKASSCLGNHDISIFNIFFYM